MTGDIFHCFSASRRAPPRARGRPGVTGPGRSGDEARADHGGLSEGRADGHRGRVRSRTPGSASEGGCPQSAAEGSVRTRGTEAGLPDARLRAGPGSVRIRRGGDSESADHRIGLRGSAPGRRPVSPRSPGARHGVTQDAA
eukprot:753961-Hanusia_phi.AAC.1